jgi:hypothetical protein
MKKVSTAAAKQSRNISQPKLTIGLDLGDRNSWYCEPIISEMAIFRQPSSSGDAASIN